jgi:hypothetical protein
MLELEYVYIKITNILQRFIDEYKLAGCDHDRWMYFKIRQGWCCLPQASILVNNILCSCLVAEGFYKAASTPSLWKHKWCPIQFCLIVDTFGVGYVGVEHFNYLLEVLK